MRCANCGNELKDGVTSCDVCGFPVGANGAAAGGSKKKLSSLTIAAIALALAAVAALVVVIAVVLTGGPGDKSSAQVQQEQAVTPKPETESAAEPEAELTDEQRALKSIEGWWEGAYHHDTMGFQLCFGNIHDDVIDWYNYDPVADDVSYVSTVNIVEVEAFSENGAQGWRFTPNTSNGWAYYLADGDEDNLPVYKLSFGYGNIDQGSYNIYSPERYGLSRITDASALDDRSTISSVSEIFAKAQAIAAERADAQEQEKGGASPAADSSGGSDQAKAEADARAEAEAAGMYVVTGTLEVVDCATRQDQVGYPVNDTSYYNPTYAILLLDEPVAMTGQGFTSGGIGQVTNDVSSILLSSDDKYTTSDHDLDYWRKYDGMQITVACSGITYADDTSVILYNTHPETTRLIAPLAEDDV